MPDIVHTAKCLISIITVLLRNWENGVAQAVGKSLPNWMYLSSFCRKTPTASSSFYISENRIFRFCYRYPGGYNAYNAAAAAAALIHLGFSEECTALSLKHFSAVFGRGEHFPIGGGTTMILIKNPAGCDQALHYLSYIKAPFSLVLILNDLEADGTDISWIWDANYEILNSLTNLESITVSGTRAEDLLIRLKYAGLNSDHISLIHENSRIIRNITASETSTVVLPTYTAMCAFRPLLTKISGVSAFGE